MKYCHGDAVAAPLSGEDEDLHKRDMEDDYDG